MFQRGRTGRRGRSVIAFRFAVLAALVGAMVLPRSAFAAVPFDQARFNASATGTAVHADALQSGAAPRLADAEEAFSSALVNSESLNGQDLNEMDRVIQPTSTTDPVVSVSNKNSYGQGSGLEIGVGLDPASAANQILINGVAEAAAPPSTDVITKEVGPVPADPIAYASLLRGQAQANWSTGGDCILGADFSTGLGYAADAQLLNTGAANADGSMVNPTVAADAPGPERAVSQSLSHTLLVRQFGSDGKTLLGKDFGLMGEVRQTIAPVTLFKGTPNEFTLELAGEWVLQAVATGLPNKGAVKGGFVHYGPGEVSPSTPIARIIQGGEVTDIVRFQDILGDEGLVIPVPGVAEIAIGEDPRAIGGDADSKPTETPTSVSGAVDVARVRLLAQEDGTRAADIRVGHMEVKSVVPAGGISCQLPVTKDANPDSVNVGQNFTSTITIENPFNCKLINVKVVDEVTTTGASRFSVVSTNPKANSVPTGTSLDEGTIVWNNIGAIEKGKSKTVSAVFTALGGAGKIIDVATATGTLSECEGEGADVAGVGSGVEGAGVQGVSRPFEVPVGGVKALAPTGVGLATKTGLSLLGVAAVTAVLLRRRRIVS
jgi:uncharacterized protein DUF11